jgi:hypothetical protein
MTSLNNEVTNISREATEDRVSDLATKELAGNEVSEDIQTQEVKLNILENSKIAPVCGWLPRMASYQEVKHKQCYATICPFLNEIPVCPRCGPLDFKYHLENKVSNEYFCQEVYQGNMHPCGHPCNSEIFWRQ